jgi:uncharacterized protein (UPF0332 family)
VCWLNIVSSGQKRPEEDARVAFTHLRLTNTVNRCYCAMFYMVSALALLDGFTSSKHKQMLGWFNRSYIASRQLDVHLKDILAYAFDSRDDGDYQDWKTFSSEEVSQFCTDTDEFVNTMEEFIRSRLP